MDEESAEHLRASVSPLSRGPPSAWSCVGPWICREPSAPGGWKAVRQVWPQITKISLRFPTRSRPLAPRHRERLCWSMVSSCLAWRDGELQISPQVQSPGSNAHGPKQLLPINCPALTPLVSVERGRARSPLFLASCQRKSFQLVFSESRI